MNAKEELLEHIEGLPPVKYVSVIYEYYGSKQLFDGKLEDVLEKLNFYYDSGYGTQMLFGIIWYEDGTWSSRSEYDGAEWWDYNCCPPLPEKYKE